MNDPLRTAVASGTDGASSTATWDGVPSSSMALFMASAASLEMASPGSPDGACPH